MPPPLMLAASSTIRPRRRLPAPAAHRLPSFDEAVVPHLRAAQRLATLLLRNEHDAEDAVQESAIRALRYFRTFDGSNGRAWFLTIVRRTCLAQRMSAGARVLDTFDEERHGRSRPDSDPDVRLVRSDRRSELMRAIRQLPPPMRRLLVLRDVHGLSYRELATRVGVPLGTVMSCLWRARRRARRLLEADSARGAGVASRTRTRPRARSGSGASPSQPAQAEEAV